MRAAQRRAIEEHNRTAWLAWHGGLMAQFKRTPKLRELMHKPEARASAKQRMRAVRQWAAKIAR